MVAVAEERDTVRGVEKVVADSEVVLKAELVVVSEGGNAVVGRHFYIVDVPKSPGRKRVTHCPAVRMLHKRLYVDHCHHFDAQRSRRIARHQRLRRGHPARGRSRFRMDPASAESLARLWVGGDQTISDGSGRIHAEREPRIRRS